METKKGKKYWEGIIEKWKESGKAQRAYCQAKRMSYWSFRYWKKRIENEQTEGEIGFVELQDFQAKPSIAIKSTIRIVFPSGMVIEPGIAFDERDLVAALRAVHRA